MSENLAYKPCSGNYWACDNDQSNVIKYGYLYKWETACEVCPSGWHLPNIDEINEFFDYLGGNESASKKIRATTLWKYDFNYINAANESGFSALPAGGRNSSDGEFGSLETSAFFWS